MYISFWRGLDFEIFLNPKYLDFFFIFGKRGALSFYKEGLSLSGCGFLRGF